jgi:hypothetical protein
VVVIGNALAGVWALGAHRWEPLRTRVLWWFTAAAELAIVVQVIMGVGLDAEQRYDAPTFHTFYGYVAIIAAVIIYSYRQQLKSRLHLLYGFGGLFLAGLGIRAMLIASEN